MKRFSALLFLLCAGTLAACSMESTCPPTEVEDHFKITGFSTSILRATFPDSSHTRPVLSSIENDTLENGRLAIQMVPETVLYSQASNRTSSFHLLPAAHACSPEEPRSEETIRDIRITGNRPFRNRSPGDTLTAFFDVVAENDAEYGTRRFALEEFLSMEPRAVEELILLLNARPDTTTRIQFTVEYEQEGPGLSRYEFSSVPVVLGPN